MDVVELEINENHVETTPVGHLDSARGVFVTSRGTEIPLTGKPISSLMLERAISIGKPKPPHIEVTLLGKHKEMQENRNDPSYLKALEEFEAESSIRTLRYLFNIGVKGQPSGEFVNEQLMFFPDATDAELKYLWVASQLPDEDIDAFSEVLLGRSMATTKGLQESADSFRSED